MKSGRWSPEEDELLKNYIKKNGFGRSWQTLADSTGIRRCGRSCRSRWLNYLRPGIKHGNFTSKEDKIIAELYNKHGSCWSLIAANLHGRTDLAVKNYWNTKLRRLSRRRHERNTEEQEFDEETSTHELLEMAESSASSKSINNNDPMLVATAEGPMITPAVFDKLLNVKPSYDPILATDSSNNGVKCRAAAEIADEQQKPSDDDNKMQLIESSGSPDYNELMSNWFNLSPPRDFSIQDSSSCFFDDVDSIFQFDDNF